MLEINLIRLSLCYADISYWRRLKGKTWFYRWDVGITKSIKRFLIFD